jgi:hypothetical protein
VVGPKMALVPRARRANLRGAMNLGPRPSLLAISGSWKC